MACKTRCAFILATAPLILGLKLQVDGKMDFGPKWNYEYRIKPLETDSYNPSRTFTAMDKQKQTYVKEDNEQPRFIDIIIKNNKSNPRLVQVAEAHIFDHKDNRKRHRGSKTASDGFPKIISDASKSIKHKYNNHNESEGLPIKFSDEHTFKFSDEHTETPNRPNINKLTKTGKFVHHLVRFAGDVDAPKPVQIEEFKEAQLDVTEEKNNYRATVMTPEKKRKHKRNRTKKNDTKIVSDAKEISNNQVVTTKIVTMEKFPAVTAADTSFTGQDLYVKPRLVKDDPKIKEFTKHIYEQSIKTFQSIKEKMNNYEMRKETDHLMRSYEERFGDFVRQTQNQKIRTRMGGQKVILNTLDTSNRILDRLVNFMIGKMDKKGVLRNSGIENVILNELNKKKELENKHICSKMQICPTSDSFSKFAVDILGTILSSDDKKVIEMRDACTEVLKNTDFSNIFDPDTQSRFNKGISDIEKYDIGTMRPIFFIMKNIFSSKNTPIKVVGKEDGRVNKTLSFLEILDTWDRRLPPNEQNMLEWNDMRNSFKEWSIGKRKDAIDLVQHFTNHATKAITKEDSRAFDRHINTILGY